MQIKTISNALVINTGITLTEVKAAKKFAPNALTVVDEHGNQLYKFGTSMEANGQLAAFGAVANAVDGDDTVVTLTVAGMNKDNADKTVSEAYGTALAALAKYAPIIKAQIAAQVAPVTEVMSTMETL